MMVKQQQSTAPWWGGGKYDIGNEPSSYVAGAGSHFFHEHLRSQPVCADYGSWSGRNIPLLEGLAGPSGKVIAVDGPWARDPMARIRARHPDVHLVEAELSSLPLENESIDVGLCWRVLHNMKSLEMLLRAIQEIHRVLRPGAPLLVAVRAWWACDLGPTPLFLRRSNGDGGMREAFYFSPSSLRRTFVCAGFEIRHAQIIQEGEAIDNKHVQNAYWAVHLVRK